MIESCLSVVERYPVVSAYVFSVGLGIPITGGWMWLLNQLLEPQFRRKKTERVGWIAMLLGVFERAIVTTLVIWAPNKTAGFIAGWMAVKIVGNYEILKMDPKNVSNRVLFFIGLLGSVVSLALAIAAGICANPASLRGLAN